MIYLDNAATTACAQKVVDEMLPYFTTDFANASSVDHVAGANARHAVEASRALVARLFRANPEDVIFTSGSTEANNLLLSSGATVFTTSIEHPSILEPYKLRRYAMENMISVDNQGAVSHRHLSDLLKGHQGPAIVSIIATNNEIGTEQRLADIADICKHYHALLHLDATQMIGTQELDISNMPVSAVSLSAHKIHGPKGVGALVAKSNVRRLLQPILVGGGQERAIRSGTLNVPGIVGFGASTALLLGNVGSFRSHLSQLRRTFLDALRSYANTNVIETVPLEVTSPHILSLRFESVNGRALLGAVGEEVCFSLGAACATNKSEPSHVLLALGMKKSDIAKTVRFSFSRDHDAKDLLAAAELIGLAALRLSSLSLA